MSFKDCRIANLSMVFWELTHVFLRAGRADLLPLCPQQRLDTCWSFHLYCKGDIEHLYLIFSCIFLIIRFLGLQLAPWSQSLISIAPSRSAAPVLGLSWVKSEQLRCCESIWQQQGGRLSQPSRRTEPTQFVNL